MLNTESSRNSVLLSGQVRKNEILVEHLTKENEDRKRKLQVVGCMLENEF